jgi:glycosyltransferase involved in cell wall biosynthesis
MAEPTVLLLHNRYREPGGEERSLAEMTALLRSRGHRVEILERTSESLSGARGRLRGGAAVLAGGLHPDEVKAAVARTGAQIVHVHNLNPLFGRRALSAAREAGARVVMHLHNYRLVCAIAIAYRDGAICTRCHGRNTFPGVRLRCRGNLAEAATYGAGISLHQKRTLELVDSFAVPSEAAVRRLGDLGIDDGRMNVLHNFVADTAFAETTAAGSGEYALFAGRLAEEKGADTAIEAAARTRVPLLVAGDGPDAARLWRLADEHVRFSGRLSPDAMANAIRRAAFAVLPSRWDEPGPYAVVEAMASGLPVLASDAGSLPELVGGDGLLPPRSVERWAAAMRDLWNDPESRSARGNAALERARELFSADRFYARLMDIYHRAQQTS